MDYRPRLYISTAFIAGILLTLGFKGLYPNLERRFRLLRRRLRRKQSQQAHNSTIVGAGLEQSSSTYRGNGDGDDDDDLIELEDHTRVDDPKATAKGRRRLEPDAMVPDGVEACVGNTPLFRIKSLSEAVGCEIWAKAEVNLSAVGRIAFFSSFIRHHTLDRLCLPSSNHGGERDSS